MSSPHADTTLYAIDSERPAGHSDHRPGRPLAVTVQTLAGHRLDDHVCRGERLHAVAADAVQRFVERGELTAGRYLITVPRLGADIELDQTSTVGEAGVVEGDVLVLIGASPQIDGEAASVLLGLDADDGAGCAAQ